MTATVTDSTATGLTSFAFSGTVDGNATANMTVRDNALTTTGFSLACIFLGASNGTCIFDRNTFNDIAFSGLESLSSGVVKWAFRSINFNESPGTPVTDVRLAGLGSGLTYLDFVDNTLATLQLEQSGAGVFQVEQFDDDLMTLNTTTGILQFVGATITSVANGACMIP